MMRVGGGKGEEGMHIISIEERVSWVVQLRVQPVIMIYTTRTISGWSIFCGALLGVEMAWHPKRHFSP